MLNPNKTKALVVSRSRTVNPPDGDLVLSVVFICTSPKPLCSWCEFDRRLTFKDHVRGVVSHVSKRIGILRLVKLVFLDTSVLLRCYSSFVLQMKLKDYSTLILEHCSLMCGSAAECHLQLL